MCGSTGSERERAAGGARYRRRRRGRSGGCARESRRAIRLRTDGRRLSGGRVESAQLDDGTAVECDLVVVGIGAVPNQELAAATGIDCDKGILVDVDGRTNDPAIFAAGDCTNRPLGSGGLRGRLESVHNAVEQGMWLPPRFSDNLGRSSMCRGSGRISTA
ncbi:FAD-dependent oxidoreductase [Nocardia gipuzkoensis]